MLESTCPELYSSIPALRLELSPQLAAFGAELSRRFQALAERLAHECQCPIPPPEAVPAPWLKPHTYRILVGGVLRAEGSAYPGRLLAVGDLSGLKGKPDLDPVRALPAYWIDRRLRGSAELQGASLSEPTEMVLRHVERTLRQVLTERAHLGKVFGQVARLMARNSNLVQRATRRVGKDVLLASLACLESEGVNCPDLPALLDRVASAAPLRCNLVECTEWMRSRLRASISADNVRQGVLECVTLHPELQQWLWCRAAQGKLSVADAPVRRILTALRQQRAPVTLLTVPTLRPRLAALLRPYLEGLKVLKTDELEPGTRLSVQANPGLVGAERWQLPWLLFRLGGARRRGLREQLEDDARLTRQSGPIEQAPEHAPPESTAPTRLTGCQTAAIFLLECPTWLMREVLSLLPARDIQRLSQEMSRMGRQSMLYRDQVLDGFPGLGPESSDPRIVTAHLRRLLSGTATGPVRELALCLLSLGPSYTEVARRFYTGLPTDVAELVRAEVAELRGQPGLNLQPALNRFARFYRGEREPFEAHSGPVLRDWLHAAVLSDPAGMARALLTTWYGPGLANYRHWAASDPGRAARWLLRWWASAPDGSFEPTEQARAAFQTLGPEVAQMLESYLTGEIWTDLNQGRADSDWAAAAALWLAAGSHASCRARN